MNNAVLEQIQRQLRPEALLGVLVAGVALTLLAAHLYVLKAPLSRYRELSHAVAGSAVETSMQHLQASSLAVETAERQVAELRSELYGASSQLPLEKLESYVIARLDRICAQHGVQLVSVTPGEMGEVLMFDELPYEVAVEGDYFALFDWLGDVEEELRPMVVSHFEMRPVREKRDAGRVEMKLRLVSYRPSGGEA
jgi:Tfp pilus assembly protein PilO